MKDNNNDGRVLLKDAMALHPHLRHVHWASDRADGGGNVTGMQHQHFVFESGLETGVYVTGRDARERLAAILVGYYPAIHGSWVSFAARRGLDVRTQITAEERARLDAEEAKRSERAKKVGRGSRGTTEEVAKAA